jgi:hypothetical protein
MADRNHPLCPASADSDDAGAAQAFRTTGERRYLVYGRHERFSWELSPLRPIPLGTIFLALCAVQSRAYAQTDEIQVYTGEIAEPGQFTLTVHNNFTPEGRKSPDFPGGIVPDHALNGVPEWAYGVNDWLELGTYLPVYTLTRDGELKFDSVKLRALFAVPKAQEQRFFYGLNFELSYNEPHWEQHRFSGEIRPIVGVRFGAVDVIVNPILDTGFDGFSRLDFAPCARIDYNVSKLWSVALEHYADFGELRSLLPASAQQHQLFAVVDYGGEPSVELGVGHGLSASSDRLVTKLMIQWILN